MENCLLCVSRTVVEPLLEPGSSGIDFTDHCAIANLTWNTKSRDNSKSLWVRLWCPWVNW